MKREKENKQKKMEKVREGDDNNIDQFITKRRGDEERQCYPTSLIYIILGSLLTNTFAAS